MTLLRLIGYVVDCALCGNHYELTRGDGTTPTRPRFCSMPDCCGRVHTSELFAA